MALTVLAVLNWLERGTLSDCDQKVGGLLWVGDAEGWLCLVGENPKS